MKDDSTNAILSTLLCTPEEARQILRIGKSAIYAAIRANEIPSIRVGDSIRIRTSWLRSQLGMAEAA